jgi:hypothetical protein
MTFGAQFLRYPDLFPARLGGEPGGQGNLAIDLPGGAYLFQGLTAEQWRGVERRFEALCRTAAPGESGVTTRVFRAPAEDFLAIDTRGWEYALDLDHEPDGVRIAGMNLMARLDWMAGELKCGLWTPEERGEYFAPVLENFLRAAFAYRLAASKGALIHSAAVVFAGRAYLLVGRSGAGKTTSARLCQEQGGTVLSDDLNALRWEGSQVEVEKLPFTGDLGETGTLAGHWPLAAILRLVKGEENGVRPLSHAAGIAALLAASPFVNRDPYRREPLFESLELLAMAVPAYELTFRLDADLRSILTKLPR